MKPMNRRRLGQQGQAMVESSVLFFGIAALAFYKVPGLNMSFMAAMLQATHNYLMGFYFVLDLPFP